MSIPFFSPIYPSNDSRVQDRCSFLRFTTHFFDFGQKPYKITRLTDDKSGLELNPGWNRVYSFKDCRFQVLLIATIVIPILMLIGLLIYRAFNSFQLGPNRLSREKLPEELYQTILQKTGIYAPQLAATSKENNERAQKDPWFQRGGTLLKESIRAADTIEDGYVKDNTKQFIEKVINPPTPKYRGGLVRNVGVLDIQNELKYIKSHLWCTDWKDQLRMLSYLAKDIAESDLLHEGVLNDFVEEISGISIHTHIDRLLDQNKLGSDWRIENELTDLAHIVALTDVQKALEIADAIWHEGDQGRIRLVAVKVLAKTDPEKAYEIAKTLESSFEKTEALKFIVAAFARSDPERGLEIRIEKHLNECLEPFFTELAKVDIEKALQLANTFEDILKYKALIGIINFIKLSNIDRALAIAGGDGDDALVHHVLPHLAISDLERALAQANSIENILSKSRCLAGIAETLAHADPARAHEIANSIEDARWKARALASLAFK